MPRHQQVTTCRRGGGPVSKFCACEHCTLCVCAVCGAYEGSLTTDCPGAKVDFDKQEEVYKTNLDYTDERGWHQGDPTERRSPRLETRATAPKAVPPPAAHAPLLTPPSQTLLIGGENEGVAMRVVGCTCGWRTPQGAPDSDAAFVTHATLANLAPSTQAQLAPTTNWEAVDHTTDLKHTLAKKAIAWVLADRICEDHAVTLTRLEDEIGAQLQKGQAPPDLDSDLLGKFEHEKIDFRLADQCAQKCDDEFRQAARKLVEALEQGPTTTLTVSPEVVGESDANYDE